MNKKLVNNIDKDNMYKVLKEFYKQIDNSFDIIKQSKIIRKDSYNNIVICGMGGSAIGGDFIKTLIINKIRIPIYVNRDYSLPKWVDKNSLVRDLSNKYGMNPRGLFGTFRVKDILEKNLQEFKPITSVGRFFKRVSFLLYYFSRINIKKYIKRLI